MNKRLVILVIFSILLTPVMGQTTYTLDSIVAMALRSARLQALVSATDQITALNQINTTSNYYPSLSLNASATYQSEALQIDIPIPGVTIPSVPLAQYKTYLQVNQLLYDGGLTKQTRQLLDLQRRDKLLDIEIRKLEITKAVSDIFFMALISQEQIKIIRSRIKTLEKQLSDINSAIEANTATPDSRDLLRATILQSQQKLQQAQDNFAAALNALSIYSGRVITDKDTLLPLFSPVDTNIASPRVRQIENQKQVLEQQNRLAAASRLPRVYAFAQAGYGRPGLNMLSDQFNPFFIGGISLSWTIYDWHKTKRQQQINKLMAKELEIQSSNLQTALCARRQIVQAQIHTLSKTIEYDNQIIKLYQINLRSAASKLKNGFITTAEYLQHLDRLTNARMQMQLHRIQLMQLRFDLQLIY